MIRKSAELSVIQQKLFLRVHKCERTMMYDDKWAHAWWPEYGRVGLRWKQRLGLCKLKDLVSDGNYVLGWQYRCYVGFTEAQVCWITLASHLSGSGCVCIRYRKRHPLSTVQEAIRERLQWGSSRHASCKPGPNRFQSSKKLLHRHNWWTRQTWHGLCKRNLVELPCSGTALAEGASCNTDDKDGSHLRCILKVIFDLSSVNCLDLNALAGRIASLQCNWCNQTPSCISLMLG